MVAFFVFSVIMLAAAGTCGFFTVRILLHDKHDIGALLPGVFAFFAIVVFVIGATGRNQVETSQALVTYITINKDIGTTEVTTNITLLPSNDQRSRINCGAPLSQQSCANLNIGDEVTVQRETNDIGAGTTWHIVAIGKLAE